MHRQQPNMQSGAALIVGMILLMVMTVLAISTMSTSSLELTMAGNTKYKENAFQLAESGIADGWWQYRRGLRDNIFPMLEEGDILPASVTNRVEALGGNYEAVVSGIGNTLPWRCLSSGGVDSPYREYHVQVRGTGNTDVRNARSSHTQGFAVCFSSGN